MVSLINMVLRVPYCQRNLGMEVPRNRKHHHKWQMAKAPNQVLRPLRNDIGSFNCNQDSTPAIEGCKYQKVVVIDGLVDIEWCERGKTGCGRDDHGHRNTGGRIWSDMQERQSGIFLFDDEPSGSGHGISHGNFKAVLPTDELICPFDTNIASATPPTQCKRCE